MLQTKFGNFLHAHSRRSEKCRGATSENVFFRDFLVLWCLIFFRFSTQNFKNIFSVRNSKVSKWTREHFWKIVRGSVVYRSRYSENAKFSMWRWDHFQDVHYFSIKNAVFARSTFWRSQTPKHANEKSFQIQFRSVWNFYKKNMFRIFGSKMGKTVVSRAKLGTFAWKSRFWLENQWFLAKMRAHCVFMTLLLVSQCKSTPK